MALETFLLEVATPERLLIETEVTSAQIPALAGEIGVLPGHAALVSELGIGTLSFAQAAESRTVFVSGGFVVVDAKRVRVLADRAENASEIDVARAKQALERAEKRLAGPVADMDVARALNAMRRAQARLAAAERK